MSTPPAQPLDVLCLGETLVDLIATDEFPSLEMSPTFERSLGGSPANVAVQIARLGGSAAIVSKVGADPLGRYCRRALDGAGVNTRYLVLDTSASTTHVFVSRTAGTPEFSVCRGADARLRPDEIPAEALGAARAVHTTAFALSRDPCRDALIPLLIEASKSGLFVSLDPNYHPTVWPRRDEALAVLRELYPHVSLTKPSLDDAIRLFGEGHPAESYLDAYHALGASTVVLSMGADGIWLSSPSQRLYFEPHRYPVTSATGAGDAFIAGLLLTILDDLALEQCVRFARECARWWLTGHRQRITLEERRRLYTLHAAEYGEPRERSDENLSG